MEQPPEDRREYPRVSKQERREFQRVIVRLETSLRHETTRQVGGWTRDLSVKGVFVLCADKLDTGNRCVCRLSLGDVLKGAPSIEAEGDIIRSDQEGVAIQFTPYTVECFKQLRDYFNASSE